MTEIKLPLTREICAGLHAGDAVCLTGELYVARDAAHKRMIESLRRGEELPFEPRGALIYYAGPAPASPGHAVGPCGPTTSSRMDAYAPALLDRGLLGMMGKGARSAEVIEHMRNAGAVYFGATGGAAALLARRIERETIVAYPELGPEALRLFTVNRFPAIVLIDARGNNLYEIGPARYRLTD